MSKEDFYDPSLSGFLKHYQPFNRLPEKDLADLETEAQLRHLPQDKVLCRQARSRLESVYIVRRGKLRLFEDLSGASEHEEILSPGETFGAISILRNKGRAMRTAKADNDCYLVAIPELVFLRLCVMHTQILDFYTRIYNQRSQQDTYKALREKLGPDPN